MKGFLTPQEIPAAVVNAGIKKCTTSNSRVLWLAILAGMFIALGAFASAMVSHSVNNTGIAKLASAAVFPVGLMLVVICGGELFTGNNLISVAFLEKKVTIKSLLNNWTIVFIGNFIGALLIVCLISASGLLKTGGGELGAYAIKTAAGKVGLSFTEVLARGILCNVLVAIAVWTAFAAQDIVGKIFACWFPVMLFVLSGYEHCVANMYFIPIGIIAKYNSGLAAASNLSAEQLAGLNWSGLIGNLIPATIGNIIGGALIIGGIYWYIYIKKEACAKDDKLTSITNFSKIEA